MRPSADAPSSSSQLGFAGLVEEGWADARDGHFFTRAVWHPWTNHVGSLPFSATKHTVCIYYGNSLAAVPYGLQRLGDFYISELWAVAVPGVAGRLLRRNFANDRLVFFPSLDEMIDSLPVLLANLLTVQDCVQFVLHAGIEGADLGVGGQGWLGLYSASLLRFIKVCQLVDLAMRFTDSSFRLLSFYPLDMLQGEDIEFLKQVFPSDTGFLCIAGDAAVQSRALFASDGRLHVGRIDARCPIGPCLEGGWQQLVDGAVGPIPRPSGMGVNGEPLHDPAMFSGELLVVHGASRELCVSLLAPLGIEVSDLCAGGSRTKPPSAAVKTLSDVLSMRGVSHRLNQLLRPRSCDETELLLGWPAGWSMDVLSTGFTRFSLLAAAGDAALVTATVKAVVTGECQLVLGHVNVAPPKVVLAAMHRYARAKHAVRCFGNPDFALGIALQEQDVPKETGAIHCPKCGSRCKLLVHWPLFMGSSTCTSCGIRIDVSVNWTADQCANQLCPVPAAMTLTFIPLLSPSASSSSP